MMLYLKQKKDVKKLRKYQLKMDINHFSLIKLNKMPIKKSTNEYIEEAKKIHDNKFDYSLINELPKRDTRVNIICRIHGIFEQSFHKHLCGDSCKKCSHEKLGKERIEKAKNKFENEANIIHTNKYDYSKSIYVSATDNINSHLNGDGCKKCAIENTRIRMSIPWETYKEQLIQIHNNKYDYSKVIWNGSDNEISVICSIHGDFIIRAQDHKTGRGCQKCSKENKIQYNKHNTEIFIGNAIQKWGNTFDYSKVDYKDSNNKVIIICKKHGEIEIFPPNHLAYGCGNCGNETNKRNIYLKEKCKREFMSKANTIHENIYDYSKSVYEDAVSKVIVICKTHGEFSISPNNHLRGRGCPACGSSNQHSRISMGWLLFMEKRYLTEIQHAKNFGEFVIPETRYKADGYIKSSNTIFEFHGDFWHGNPKLYDGSKINPRVGITYGELYNQTIEKSKVLLEKGYTLIEIWENDWKKFIKSIRILQKIWKSYNK